MTILALLFILACIAVFVASTIVALANRKFRVVASIFAALAFCGGSMTAIACAIVIASM